MIADRPKLAPAPRTEIAPRPRASRRELWLITAFLAIAAAAIYGPHVFEGGFTLDDYGHAVTVQHPQDGILQDYWKISFIRPGLVLYIPFTHIVLGPHPELHLALALVLAVLVSIALYALLRRFALAKAHAGAIALLVLLFPWSDSTRFWAVAGHISLAIALGLAGVLLALRGLDAHAEGRRRRSIELHAGAVVLYALSVLTYEIAAGVLLLVGALYFARSPVAVARSRWLVDLAVILPCLAWNLLRADRERLSFAATLDHAEAITDAGATVLALAALPSGGAGRQTVLAVLAAVVIAAIVVRQLLPADDDARPELLKWLVVVGVGMLIVVASWILYVPADPYYSPGGKGVGNRVNVMAGLGVVLAVYGVLVLSATLLFRGLPRWRQAAGALSLALALVLVAGYASDVRDDQQAWARASTKADGVLDAIQATVPDPQPASTIYTFGHAGAERGGMPIFDTTWDLKGAVRLSYDDPSLNAYPMLVGTTMDCSETGVQPTGGNWSDGSYGARYGSAYFVDAGSSTGERIDSREQCLTARSRFVPGPIMARL